MKKKILFIIWTYTCGGGAESLLTSIVNHLNPDKYEISIIEYHHEEVKKEPINDNIHVLPYIQSDNKLKMHFQSFQLYNCPQLLINTYIKKDYDLYVAFNYLVPTFLLPKDTKNISWIHSDVYDLLGKKSVWKKTRQSSAFNNVNKIVAISDNTEKSLMDLFPQHKNKLIKIYNGVDIERIRKKSFENTAVELKHPSILFVGRLEGRKHPIRLLNVLKLIHEKGVRAHLYFLGKGEQEHEILEQTQRYNLSEFVHMLGYQQNPFPIIKQCDVVSLLSKSEGFSMCLLESVALGRPFVSTNIGGALELSNDQSCGRIIETDEQAADAICFWIKSDKKEILIKCQNAIERFGLKQYISQIENLFDRVMAENI